MMKKQKAESHLIERVERGIEEIRAGKMVILVDDADRENEGDLCMASELATPEAINFMAKYGRGLICLSLEDEQLQREFTPSQRAEFFGDAPVSSQDVE